LDSGELLDPENIKVDDSLKFNDYSREKFIADFKVESDLVFAFQDYVNLRTKSQITFVAYHEEVKQYIKAALVQQVIEI